MSELLPFVEISTSTQPKYSVIWLHGLGADGHDFESIVPELKIPASLGVRFIFPHAPQIPVTCNGGYIMPAWYDIISLDRHTRTIDTAGIIKSREAIRRLIENEKKRGVSSDHIFLAGFSQGGAVAYTTALTHPEKLAGIIALSTYIPSIELIKTEITLINKALPILAAHGTEDDIVSIRLGLDARDFLKNLNYNIDWQEYPMSHSVSLDEIRRIGQWLTDKMFTP